MGMMIHRNKMKRLAEQAAPIQGAETPEFHLEDAINAPTDSDIMFEERPDKQYTKTDINRMGKAELVELAKNTGVEGADGMSGTELKEYLLGVFGLQ